MQGTTSAKIISSTMSYLENKQFGLINISKSGTTTEPASLFACLRSVGEQGGQGGSPSTHRGGDRCYPQCTAHPGRLEL